MCDHTTHIGEESPEPNNVKFYRSAKGGTHTSIDVECPGCGEVVTLTGYVE